MRASQTATHWAHALLAGLALTVSAQAQIYGPPQGQVYAPARLLKSVGISQNIGTAVPLDAPFVDESGRDVFLRSYLDKPVILALVYYQCPSLCNMVLEGVLTSVDGLELKAGKDYEVVVVSFDPRETAEMAKAKKADYLAHHPKTSAAGLHFLTGPETSSKALANTVGFRYAFDSLTNQYAHSSAIMILTPGGRVARYFYGIQYPPRDVRLGLIEASQEKLGSPTDQVLLYCFHYDPVTGKYAVVVMNVLRLGALITLGALGTFLVVMLLRDRRLAHGGPV